MRFLVTSTLIGAILVPGPAAAAVAVQSSPDVDYTAYESYAWKEGTPARRPEAQERIVKAVERELTTRGLLPVTSEPDIWVSIHALVDKHTLEQLSDPTYWNFVTGIASVDPYDVKGGTLVIDLVEGRSDLLVWRGVAETTVSGPLDRMAKKVDKIVRKLFRQYPSGADR